MPKILDNIQNSLSIELKSALEISYRSDFCVGYFNLRGWKEVVKEIEKFEGGEEKQARVLVGMQKQSSEVLQEYFTLNEDDPIDNNRANKIRKDFARDFKNQLTIGIPTEADEKSLQALSKQLKDKKVVVKLFLKHTLHAKLYLAVRDDKFNPLIGFVGSSNLTFSGLVKQGELNVDVLEQDAAIKLQQWFNDRWSDRWCIDITNELIDAIDTSWATEKLITPYYIYLKIAYHLSREARTGIAEFNIPRVFNNILFDYQKKAVLIAAHHLHKRDGVLVGDVVGLGKTLTACAVAKIFEDDFFLETLIICPKNLTVMWEEHTHKYQLRAKVMAITEVQNKLFDMRRYRLVVIDESHNLRNRNGKRYSAIKEYLQRNNSKVILLTATPYNKDLRDLSNQIRLFLEDDKDIGISPEQEIERIGGRAEFNAEYQVAPNTIAGFEKSDFMDDWRELMRLFMVRRTRSFIKNNYAKEDETKRKYIEFHDGTKSYFPDRFAKKLEYVFDANNPNDQYAKFYSLKVVNQINSLDLPRYGIGNYLRDDANKLANKQELIIIENLSRAGKRLMGFARTNLFKRLESSGFSFLLSLARHIIRNYTFVYAINNNLPLPIGQPEKSLVDGFIDDLDLEENSTTLWGKLTEKKLLEVAENSYNAFSNSRNKFDWIRSELFKNELKSHLEHDADILFKIFAKGQDWKPENDKQLNALYDLCTQKHKKEKVLVFTQYSDTAKYIYDYFENKKVKNIALATGDVENPTALAIRFSPLSNEKHHIVGSENELRILISTDVLSEGQNLQDSHIILNYDLPWAIIRLIQRAGRVDRIGQKSDKILCYSILPEDGIENIINLRRRLTNRITENAEVVGSDETFFEGDPVNITDLYNEKSGILDEDEETEVDLASYAYQIWNNAIEKDSSLKKKIQDLPNVVFATKELPSSLEKSGVITYARTSEDNDFLTLLDTNKNIISQSQLKILKYAECTADTKALSKIPNHHELVQKGLEEISDVQSRIGGQLGRKTSARYQVYKRLERHYEDNADTLFQNDTLKRAIEDIYKYPLREIAKEIFNRQLKAGIGDEQLADLVVSLRDENKLSIIDESDVKHNKTQIICSLGLKQDEVNNAL